MCMRMPLPVILIVIQIKQNGTIYSPIGNFMIPVDVSKMLIKSKQTTTFYNKTLALLYLTCTTQFAPKFNK